MEFLSRILTWIRVLDNKKAQCHSRTLFSTSVQTQKNISWKNKRVYVFSTLEYFFPSEPVSPHLTHTYTRIGRTQSNERGTRARKTYGETFTFPASTDKCFDKRNKTTTKSWHTERYVSSFLIIIIVQRESTFFLLDVKKLLGKSFEIKMQDEM